MLEWINVQHVGPAKAMGLELGPRVNVITGDNGLGKTFLLDVAWWALTRSWAGDPAMPHRSKEAEARIEYRVVGRKGPSESGASFDMNNSDWTRNRGRPPVTGLAVYARVDGSYAVMDPARSTASEDEDESGVASYRRRPTSFAFDQETIWDGLKAEDGSQVCNGLLSDWNVWQLKNAPEYDALCRVLEALSPDDAPLRPGLPRRIDLHDSRDIPTISMPYGEVAVTQASAGVRRILALAYLLVWSWHEHVAAAQRLGEQSSRKVVLLVDEIEAHLHPRWQRSVLPAVITALRGFDPTVDPQVLCVTHAPLVLASLEPVWDDAEDRLFVLDAEEHAEAERVVLRRESWRPRGDANTWLKSSVFDRVEPRSPEAERAIRLARDLLTSPAPDSLQNLTEVHRVLSRVLPDIDPILARLDRKIQAVKEHGAA